MPEKAKRHLSELDLTGRSFLTIHDYTPAEVVTLLDLAAALKDVQKRRVPHAFLEGRAVAMIFMKTSTRTRMSFEVGIEQLGAQPIFLNAGDIQLRVGETIKDTANVMSRYVDCIMIRTFAQQDVEDLARYGQIPVINGLTDDHHPCQGMADALTIREHVGRLEGVKLAYIGDGNNVAHSLAEVGAKTGMHVVICTPEDYRPDAAIIARAQADAAETGATVTLTANVEAAVANAHVIYTDTFTSMGQEAEHDARLAAMKAYQVNAELLELAGPQVKVMHCLPAHWGEEITEEVLYSESSVVFDQAENRLHAQKAIMAAAHRLRRGPRPHAAGAPRHERGRGGAEAAVATAPPLPRAQIQLGNHMMCSKYLGEIGSPRTIGTNATTMPIASPATTMAVHGR